MSHLFILHYRLVFKCFQIDSFQEASMIASGTQEIYRENCVESTNGVELEVNLE